MNKTLISKISRLVLLSSLLFNILSVNGYSSLILGQVCQSVQNNVIIFQINNEKIVLAQTVEKNLENMLKATKSMLTVVGFVDNLFKDEALANEQTPENSISLGNKVASAVVSIVNNVYIFSFESVQAMIEQKFWKGFFSNGIDKTAQASADMIALNMLLISPVNVYEDIKFLFVDQNLGNHSKIYLNILENDNTFLNSGN